MMGCTLSGLSGPIGSQNSKVTLQHFLWIVLLDNSSFCLFHIDLTLTAATVT